MSKRNIRRRVINNKRVTVVEIEKTPPAEEVENDTVVGIE
jgi:hypothetical protein